RGGFGNVRSHGLAQVDRWHKTRLSRYSPRQRDPDCRILLSIADRDIALAVSDHLHANRGREIAKAVSVEVVNVLAIEEIVRRESDAAVPPGVRNLHINNAVGFQ